MGAVCYVVFGVLWALSAVSLVLSLLFGAIAKSGDGGAAVSAISASFWTLVACTVILLLCQIEEALRRLSPPPGRRIPDVGPTGDELPGQE